MIVPLNVYNWLITRHALTFLDFLLIPAQGLLLIEFFAWLNQTWVVEKVDLLSFSL